MVRDILIILVTSYEDLIIVLTDYCVLFYQKMSIPDVNRSSCIISNYT